jgi:hypothetical protein
MSSVVTRYHLREVEKQRLVKLVGRRRRGNRTARILRATAQAYVIGPTAPAPWEPLPPRSGTASPPPTSWRLRHRAVQEVGELGARAEGAGRRLSTLTLETEVRLASAESRADFAEELTGAVARLTGKYPDGKAPGGRTFRFLVAGYPAPATQESRHGQGREGEADRRDAGDRRPGGIGLEGDQRSS